MKLIYRFGILLARLFLPLAALMIPRIAHFLDGRKTLFEKLSKFKEGNSAKTAWFHVASLGEYEQAIPVIESLKTVFPDYHVVISFFSPSGYDHVIKKPQQQVDFISYLPIDTKRNAEKFVQLLNPDLVFFVKYDLWYHHLSAIKTRKIPLYLISASFRSDQIYFKRIPFFRNLLFFFDQIFTQNQNSIDLLQSIGYSDGMLAGDTRFDRVVEIAKSPKIFEDINKWKDERPVLVAGSVWGEDMSLLIPLINSNPDYRWIIAPHSLDPSPMIDWASRLKVSSVRYSEWDKSGDYQVIFIDNIGMLSSLYQFAKLAYVGGAFGKGLHNILEPIAFGAPVIYGKLKKESKFPEAAQSQLQGCGFEVEDFEGLNSVFENLQDSDYYKKSKDSAMAWVEANRGAAAKIISKISLKGEL
ncbi:MAG: glycosyltransferase N-terminal domain-containing protein [Algoriphagus sp.]|uniref:3-deoxy-D-manno-octulosonic acid transferase n=1 Tax=Algoriphagus sp. TaxID=1872435 RepID=UPI0026310B31|nr:glycosyltransferase N-terminal domain-containing protein [Algoriphagus sp.]MDG1279484.1 glycosyltransferase N-terminal domain-containing protein [Algoriphagus sp.]